MGLQDPTIRPYLWDIFASEVSYMVFQSDRDWDVMTAWITRVKDQGVDFFNDPEVVTFRQKVLQSLWQNDEDRRLSTYDRIQQIPSDQLDAANAEYQDILAYQAIISGLLAGDCTWFGV